MAGKDALPPESLLADAYGPERGCPSPEIFLAAEWDALDDAARRNATRHLESCPACRAERRLARAFDAGDDVTAAEPIDAIVAAAEPARRSPRSTRWLATVTGLAAAVLVGIAIVPALDGLLGGSPRVAGPGSYADRRGVSIDVLAPTGDIATAPDAFSFAQIPGAERYEIVVTAVDGRELWRASGSTAAVTLSREMRTSLRPAVTYHWQVTAFDANGNRLAWSKLTSFKIRLADSP